MKICAIICEFNPFHNGHKYLIDKARELSGCDVVLCIMGGNFTQRGEMCILDKYTRARHAVLGGADCVIQLPAAFTVAPAEIFAEGAVKILSSIPQVTHIAFGCESGDKEQFVESAKLTLTESEQFKAELQARLATGDSYIKSYNAAFKACGGKLDLSRPNNILGLEYATAVLKSGADIEIIPIRRIGADYDDQNLSETYSSASAIRKNTGNEKVQSCVPEYVYEDLKNANRQNAFEDALRYSLFLADRNKLCDIYGCGEGLENKLKALENNSVDDIVAGATSRRYSSSRIKRILCANLLNISRSGCEAMLGADLYIRPLAIRKNCADRLLAAMALSPYPLVAGPYAQSLEREALECFKTDAYELAVYNNINRTALRDYMITV